jgi:L-fuconolactonase
VRDQPWLAQPELAPLRRNFLLADLEPEAAAAGVTSTVVVQTVAEPGETPEMLALAADSSLIAGVVGWVDLEAPDVADAIGALRQLPGGELLVGIRHPVLMERDQDWLIRPAVLRGVAAVAAAGLVFDVVVQPRQLAAAVSAAKATPQLTLVLDHFGNPDVSAPGASPLGASTTGASTSDASAPDVSTTGVSAPDSSAGVDESWASAFSAFAALPNTVGKFSGILGETAASDGASIAHLRPYYEMALARFGPQRLMFGSDWPVSTMMIGYDGVHAVARALTADLSPEEKAAIFYDTAQRTYRLQPAR